MLACALLPTSVHAATQVGTGPANPPAGALPIPRMDAYRLEQPLEIDGRLDEDVWTRFPPSSGFVQKEPVEGAPARNDSEVWVFYDDDAIYVGAIVHDETPSTIVRNMVRRDANAQGQFDYFEVMFDPNLDGRTGYRFRITAANVQTDRYLYDDSREDAAWDAVWSSGARIDERGWTVEMRIPLSQMRYETSADPQTWGVNFGRRRISDNELTRLRLESRLVTGRVSQFALLDGILLEGAASRTEIRPYVVSSGHKGPADAGNPFFDGSEVSSRFGFDLRYGLGSAFTLDATINPDFGQVEADPAVVNLSAFETFFQERRPFFVEDSRVFDFPLSGRTNSLFYSRRVGRAPSGSAPDGAEFADIPDATTILGATKITGRTSGGLSVGALGALTARERGHAAFPGGGEDEEFTVEPTGMFAVLRLEQDFRGGASNVGGIFTTNHRSLPPSGEFDRLATTAVTAGIDFDHNWSDRTYGLSGFFAESHVRGDAAAITRILRASNHYRQRPDLAWGEYDTSATRLSGAEWRLQLDKRRGQWRAGIWAAEVTPDFEVNDLGFSTSPERLDGGVSAEYQGIVPNAVLRMYTLSMTAITNMSHEVLNDFWSFDSWSAARTGGSISANGVFTFTNFWNLTVNGGLTPQLMSRTLTRGGPRMVDPASKSLRLSFRNDDRGLMWFRPSVNLVRGDLDSGDQTTATLGLTFQPSARLRLSFDPAYTWQKEGAQYVASTDAIPFADTYGRRYIFADLDRRSFSLVSRADYTFSPDLTFEFFSQALLSAGDYTTYKQLLAPESFAFDRFAEGSYSEAGGVVTCSGARTCEGVTNQRHLDFDGDGRSDFSFTDRDFNVRSLRTTAVLRWEYRPGSTVFFVWQHRQAGSSAFGDFDLGRDFGAMWDAPSDDTFILKVNLWLSG